MRWRIALVVIAAIIVAHLLWLAVADPADADDHGIVVTCATVQVWDILNLGTVTVTRPGGVATYTPGNALTVAYVTAAGPVTAVVTAHHSYTVSAPAGCATTTSSSSTTTSPSTTTSAPVTPSTAPPSTTPPLVPSSTVPGPTVPPPPSEPGTTTPPTATTLPPAPPAQPVVTTPAFTG